MPICNKTLILTATLALFTAPVFADGTPGQRINRGPAPLQAHNMAPPEPGCVLIEGNTWSCPAPQRAVQQTTQTVRRSAPSTLTLDLASFSGGVGNGVDGGFYGGGGIIILGGDRRFSGVLSHAASAFTFRQRRTHRSGGGAGCGCMGGGD